ncbi:MAG: peptidylprolyl isomerase [Planctomycetota bacterium]|nr:peptidylprolyl isomerase [Planctomycetota bacterium]
MVGENFLKMASVLLFPLLAASAGEGVREMPSLADPMAAETVAVVGSGRVGADQVFELWTPIWYETLAKVRNGKLDAGQGDAQLTREWRRALNALIKDELFFQEAEREHHSAINGMVENFIAQGDPRSRNQITAYIRQRMNQEMERYFRQLNSELVRESGGMVKLRRVLEERRLTFMEWQHRLRKKAFTQTYLREILHPRAPDPGPRRVQEYYAGHPDEFRRSGLVRFRHIFFANTKRGGTEAARRAAVEAWQELDAEEIDFEAAARKYSDDPPSRERGGLETGEEADDPEREAWLADIRAALREEVPETLAPILESPFGCHLAKLISIGQDRKIPFNEVSRDIERKLQAEVWEEATDRYFESIRRKTDIRVLMADFPAWLSCAAQAGMDAGQPRIYRTDSPGMRAIEPGSR